MNYDTWKAHDPLDDEDYRAPACATPGCENRVTFPDLEIFCSACLARLRQRSQELTKAKVASRSPSRRP